MAIEFSCPHCEHRLRTSDDKAGLSAKCPACGEMIWVPYSQPSSSGEASPAPPPVPPPVPDNPLGEPIPAAEAAGTSRDAEYVGKPLPSQDEDILEDAFETAPPPRRRIVAAEVICPGCQASNDAGARECRFCGTSLEGVEPLPTREEWQPPRPEIGEIMAASWRIFQSEIGLLIGSTLVTFLLALLMVLVCALPVLATTAMAAAVDDDATPFGIAAGCLLALPLWALGFSALSVGYIQLNLRVARGEQAGLGDLFHGIQEGRWTSLGMVVVGAAYHLIGLVLCGLGRIFAWPLLYAQVERGSIGESFDRSWKMFSEDAGTVVLPGLIVLGLQIACGLLNLCAYIGTILLIFVVPFGMVLRAVAYLRLTRQRTAIDLAT